MFANTGDLSMYFGIALILMALIIVAFVFILVLLGTDQDKIERITEIGKWFIVSVAVVAAATIIVDQFKERDQDLKEVEVLDRHIATIIKAEDVEQRRLLAEYFSYLAPPGELRKSWQEYNKAIVDRIAQSAPKKVEELELRKAENRTPEQDAKLESLARENSSLDKPLISLIQPEEWAVIAGTDTSVDQAEFELIKARKISPAARIYKSGSKFFTIITGNGTRAEAERHLTDAKRDVNNTSFLVNLKNLCPNRTDTGTYIECQ